MSVEPSISRPRTLVIDDDPMCCDTLAAMLAHLGMTSVAVVDNAGDALSLIEQDEFDLIFCDLKMPTCDGVEMLRMLASRHVTAAIILLSGSDQRLLKTAQALGQSRGLHVSAALKKPIRLKQLRAALGATQDRVPAPPTSVAVPPTPLELERGIADNQLVLHYQPQIALDTNELVGFEALVRWQHPIDGLRPPSNFIPVAEGTPLMNTLTDWVIESAVDQLRTWRRAGLDTNMSVNIAATTLQVLDFPDRLVDKLRDADVAPEALTLEVTESGFFDDSEALLDVAARLRLKGFPLSIDDFGTGHSNLAHLRSLPFTELKLDRSFVQAAPNDKEAVSVLQLSVDLAERLDLSTVAEGIETQVEWEMLQRLGVHRGQGYLMSRPMPASEVQPWLASWRNALPRPA